MQGMHFSEVAEVAEGWAVDPRTPTFPNFRGRPAYNTVIDHIFYWSPRYAPERYEVCVHAAGVDASDHRLMRVSFVLK